jgi:NAD(P)-dependent dehydrogenase (short-subunit alcohol dehydrogenase family)
MPLPVISPMDLTGSTVLVTGASSGIGRETAILLSTLNARLVITGRNAERLEQTRSCLSGEGHLAEVFDLSNLEQIPKWVRSVAAKVGPLKALVHAAGEQYMSPIRFVTAKAVDDLFKTNLQSAVMLAQGFCHKTCHTPESSMVFFSSVLGLSGKPAMSVYGASKAGLLGLAQSLAAELAADRIRVNCIAPAYVQTEMLDQIREWPEQFAALEKQHPLGFGTPRDVANAVAFLVAETGRWITGSTLVVDGGYSNR